jgi:hypothetical protein
MPPLTGVRGAYRASMKTLLKFAAAFGVGFMLMVLVRRLPRDFHSAPRAQDSAPRPHATSAPLFTFQKLSDYQIPAGSVLYTSNPEDGPATSIRTPVEFPIAIITRTDLGPLSLGSWAQRSATLRCDGKFYLEVRPRHTAAHVYFVRPSVPYNPHLGMTWLQAKAKWPDPKCG